MAAQLRVHSGLMSGLLGERSFVHNVLLALVWVAMAMSGFVFSEPAPTDALTIALFVLLPAAGLVRFEAGLAPLMLVLAGAGAAGLVASTTTVEFGKATTHTAISIYLYGATLLFAAFVALKPVAHTRLIFSGLTVAALIAAAAGLAGAFALFPGAEMFTKFGRAAGTFKDPNVFGPFLVPPLGYALHRALELPLRRALPQILIVLVLTLGVLLSFSRGAWMNLALTLGLYVVLAFLTAPSNRLRHRIAALAVGSVVIGGGAIGGTLQFEKVASLVAERASLAQSYDVGPDGRFGGQQKAIGLILDNPGGIGAGQFALRYHHEEPHNVYLSMPLNAGWVGAGLYIIAVLATLAAGIAGAFRRTEAQPLLLVVLSGFAANAVEGLIVDTDHWRHFYLLMGLVWGITLAPNAQSVQARMSATKSYVSLRRRTLVRA